MGLFDGKNAKSEGKRYTAAGHTVTCSHCGNQLFWTREAQLNTAGMSFLDLDFLNKTADVYVCTECGHLEWFL